jgi:hypothetical protein
MPKPMPSPNGTNHEGLYLPDNFPLAKRGAAYDAALPRDEDDLDEYGTQGEQVDEYCAPIEEQRPDDVLDLLRSILESSNVDPVLVDKACDHVRKVVADSRRKAGQDGVSSIRKSYSRSRIVGDEPPDRKDRPEVGKGPAQDAALAAARENIGRLRGGPMAYLPSSHRLHTPTQRHEGVAMGAAKRIGSFEERFPDVKRIKFF